MRKLKLTFPHPVSLYNAVTLEAVRALVGFMREFQRTHG